jgi:threonine dehydrogenase-like Zn-dependent dehydrogenase
MPREIDPVGATVLLTLKEMCSALENFGLETGMDVLIYGDGPVGLALAQFARLQGADTVAVVGHHDDRLERIKRVGKANTVINSHDQSVVETLGNQRFDLAVDAAGRIDVIREAASLLNPRGKVGVTGVLSPEESTLRLTDLPNNIAVQMLNWPYGEHAIHNRVVEYVTSGRIDLSDYYSHVLPLEEAARAVEMLRNREAWRIALRP